MIHGLVKPIFGTALNRSHPLAAGLVSQYLFNEGCGDLVHDSCGQNDGRTSGMAPMSPASGWVPGPQGGALAFDGSGGQSASPVTLPSPSPDIASIHNGDWTMIARCCPSSLPNNGGLIILYGCGIVMGEANVFSILQNNNCQIKTPTIPLNLWVAIAATRTGTTYNLYTNGIEAHTANVNATWSRNIYSIGRGYDNVGKFAGLISSVSIYNRALSAEEIAYLYAFPWAAYDSPASAWEYNQQNRNFDHYYHRLMAA